MNPLFLLNFVKIYSFSVLLAADINSCPISSSPYSPNSDVVRFFIPTAESHGISCPLRNQNQT